MKASTIEGGATSNRFADGQPVHNALLRRMPLAEFKLFEPNLHYVDFRLGEYLGHGGTPVTDVYFLNGGLASMMVETSDARSVEIGLIGPEGMIPLPVVGEFYELTYSVVVQVRGNGFRVTTSAMKRMLPVLPELSRMLLRRLAIRSVEQAQNAACNRLHSMVQRLARWLLLTHDRLSTDTIPITHDFLSKMIGTDRAAVSLALAQFEREKILLRGRGSVKIIGRRKLEAYSCECYEILRRSNLELGLRA